MKRLFTLAFLTVLTASQFRAQSNMPAQGDNSALVNQVNTTVDPNTTNTQPAGVTTGVQSIEQTGGPATVFPNPCVGEFNINVGGNSTLILFNDIMQNAMEMQLNPGHNHVQSSLATGVYYYIIHSGNQTLGGHLIVQ